MTRSTPTAVFVVSHSHFDPEWIDSYDRYLKTDARHTAHRLELWQRDRTHRFCLPEELATLPFLESCGFRLRRLFREAVQEGGIELKGAIASGDLTMNQGESIARQFVLGRFLLERALKMSPPLTVAQNIDNYALCPQLPQILRQCDREYLVIGVYQERGQFTRSALYFTDPPTNRPELWWRGPDGSTILTLFSYPNYGGIGPRPTRKSAHAVVQRLRQRASARAVFVFSGGDMAPPDPDLPAKLRNWSDTGHDLRIGLPREYFEAVRSDPTIPRVQADAITDHLGAFESHARFKQANRRVENLLLTAEKFATAASTLGHDYPHEHLNDAWYHLLINQHHDGALACLRDVLLDDVAARYRHAEAMGRRTLLASLRAIAVRIHTSAQQGRPVVVFNPLAWKRDDAIRVEIPCRGGVPSLQVFDADGNPCAAYVRQKGGRAIVEFLASGVPSLGYKVFYVTQDSGPGIAPRPMPRTLRFSGRHLRGVLDQNGETLYACDRGDMARLNVQADYGCANVIRLRGAAQHPTTEGDIHATRLGQLGWSWQRRQRFGDSQFIEEFRVYRGVERVDVHTRVVWRDKGHRVRLRVPVRGEAAVLHCHEPFMIHRRDQASPTVRKPALFWAGALHPDTGRGIAIANRGTHSYSLEASDLCMTLFRSADPRHMVADVSGRDKGCGWCMVRYAHHKAAEAGRNTYNYSLLPSAGDNRRANLLSLHRRAHDFNHPLIPLLTGRRQGDLPSELSFMSVEGDRVILSAWKHSHRGASSVVRLYEPLGETASCVRMRLAHGQFIGECNIDERTLRRRPKPARKAGFTFKPFQIRSFTVSAS